ncbi:MAG: hypothetical protein ABIO83_11330 [Ilumatobacteraceae bacterium]
MNETALSDPAVVDDFAFEYGTWTVRHRRLRQRLCGAAEWEQFDGTTTCAPILGGVGNLEQVWMPSISTTGMALRLYDVAAGEWSIYWSSSATGRLEPPVVGTFTDGVGTFEGDDTWAGEPIRVRFVWESLDAMAARWTQAFRRPADAEWEVNWVMEFTRMSYEAIAPS